MCCCLGGCATQGGLECLDVHSRDAACQTSVSGGAPFWLSGSLHVLYATWSQSVLFFFLRYDTTLADDCIALAQRWIKVGLSLSTSLPDCLPAAEKLLLLLQAKESDLDSFKQSDVKVLSSHQLIEFLSLLLQEVNRLTGHWFRSSLVDW